MHIDLLFTAEAATTALSLLRLPLLPRVTQRTLALDDDQPWTEPTQTQLAAILQGLPGLVTLTLEHFAAPLQTIIDLGRRLSPRCDPRDLARRSKGRCYKLSKRRVHRASLRNACERWRADELRT